MDLIVLFENMPISQNQLKHEDALRVLAVGGPCTLTQRKPQVYGDTSEQVSYGKSQHTSSIEHRATLTSSSS